MVNIKKINLPYKVKEILKKLISAGYEAYVVGGSVRDQILGLEVSDYDITTNALPESIMEVFKDYKIIETGLKHGTITLIYEDESFEITTYRVDGEYEDGRHPKEVKFTDSLKEDLRRRDFTINALAANIDGDILDYFDGLNDLENKLIKCVGNPEDRFTEDGLRILRALRFSSKLGFDIDENTKEAMFKYKNLLNKISKERIQKEFNGILLSKYNLFLSSLIYKYSEILEVFIPELKTLNMNQNNKYHKNNNLYHHTLAVLENTRSNLYLRLAALFHDIGKPESYSESKDENGVIQGHFYNHPVRSYRITLDIMKRLKYSNLDIESVCWLVENHDYTFTEKPSSMKKLLNKAPYQELVDLLIDLRDADRKDHIYSEKDKIIPIETIRKIKEDILNYEEPFSLKQLAVNGYDMLEAGFQGVRIGEALNYLLNAVLEEKVKNTKEDLITYLLNKDTKEIKPCPFCGNTKLEYSLKKSGRFDIMYHATFRCTKCHTYGPRVLSKNVSKYNTSRDNVDKDESLKLLALEAWNNRN